MITTRILALVTIPLWIVTFPAAMTPSAPGVPLASFDLDALLGSGWCPYLCDEGCRPGGDWHRIIDGGPNNNAESDGYEGCDPGTCSPKHDCDRQFATTERDSANLLELEAAIGRSTYAELAAFVKANTDRIRLNRERVALQLLGCNDAVVASYTSHTTPAIGLLLLQ